MNRHNRWTSITSALLLLVSAAAARADRDLDELESYSYVRALDGTATLASAGYGPGETAELNQPLMAGDTVRVARGARVEIALADRNLLRVGGDSTVVLSSIAFSGDRGDRVTRLDIERGEVVLVVSEEALGDSLPELRSQGIEVVIHEPGVYRVEADATGWTEVLVRQGYAEVVSRRGSTIVRTGEAATAWSSGRAVDLYAAGGASALERWGDELSGRAARARRATLDVEPSLAYQAAPLADYGTWVSIDSVSYWQPRVEVGWRPYWRGRWAWTPSGLTWVSSEPWGWVPYHYGTWTMLGGYGWVWRPGRLYSPAWVYWHVSDAWTGWCPVGYYTSWYGRRGWDRGFGWGSYGWAGGSWNDYSNWCFRPTRRVCDRDWRRWHRGGSDLGREHGGRVPRGILTTDTRGLPRDGFDRPGILQEFERRARGRFRDGVPDVTDFVARKGDLPPTVVRAIEPRPTDRIRLAEVPRTARRDDPAVYGRRGPAAGTPVTDREPDLPGGRPWVDLGGGDKERTDRPDTARVRPQTGTGVVLDTGRNDRPATDRPVTRENLPRPVTPGRPVFDSDDRRTYDTDRRTTPAGDDRQQWRRSAEKPAVGVDERPRSTPIGRLPETDRRPTLRPTAPNGTTVRVPPAATGGRPVSPQIDDRQGWRTDRPAPPATRDDRARPVTSPRAEPEPPVQRVLRGVPRSEPTPPPRYGSNDAGRRWQRPTTPTPPVASPRFYDRGQPRTPVVVAPPAPRSGSDGRVLPVPGSTPRVTPRVSTPSARPAPPSRSTPSVSPRATPPSNSRQGSSNNSSRSGSRSSSSSSSGSRDRGDRRD